MKICVCFKIVPDLDQVLESDWDTVGLELDTSYVKKSYNCFDEAALEMALRIKDSAAQKKEEVLCTALTVGKSYDAIIKSLYAVGVERVVNIPCEKSEFCQTQIAKMLGAFIEAEGFDLVLTGKQCGMGDSGMVPAFLCEYLGYPLVSEVIGVHQDNEGLCFDFETSDGIVTMTVEGPVVAAVGNAEHAYLRLPTLREKMVASKREIEKWEIKEKVAVDFPQLSRERQFKKCYFVTGETAQEKGRFFYKTVIEGVSR